MKVKIRVRGLIDHEGHWAIYGYDCAAEDAAVEVLYDMMTESRVDTIRSFWLTAEVELPQELEIAATEEVVEP